MAGRKQRDIFLATCLLESIEDENYRNTRKLLIEHHADPNLLIPESNIAAIHFAAGMENTAFAEAAMKIILKCNGNPNVQTIDGETPLHIAVIWNRTLIVEMLLDHGADISITDNEKNTPINHAITERHYNLIPIFQNHVFEKKLQKRADTKMPHSQPNKITDKIVNSFRCLEIDKNRENDNVLTPNRTNYNFKEASPFLVHINQRQRRKRCDNVQNEVKELQVEQQTVCPVNALKPDDLGKKDAAVIIEISDSDDDKEEPLTKGLIKNLFDLTEENVEKHLKITTKRGRKDSLIDLWRNKVNESRTRKSILPINETDFEAFISENTEETESSQQSVDTVIQVKPTAILSHKSETEDSFITAADENGGTFVVEKDVARKQYDGALEKCEEKSDVILQTQEVYEHFDPETNIIFYENKLLANRIKAAPKIDDNADNDVVVLNTSSESGTCTDLAVPTDYDTDDLRNELKGFGDVPGPITKNTKRLYLKRLIRYKRRPHQNNVKNSIKCNFSVELQKTMKTDITSLDFINEYATLECRAISSFQLGAGKNMREGHLKKSFIYLLIDPRIAENLLAESQIISAVEVWCRFLKSIFYVGKGKSSRPYAHLYDAIKIYHDECVQVDKLSKFQESLKLDRIIEIWRANKGVICLPVFHNITPSEAYTREAAIIDCLGVENLTNIKRGDYYGISKSWTMRDRKRLGVLLLYKAMQVFLVEGESQLRPNDIK